MQTEALQHDLCKTGRIGFRGRAKAQRVVYGEINQQAHGVVLVDAVAALVHVNAQLFRQFGGLIVAADHRGKHDAFLSRPGHTLHILREEVNGLAGVLLAEHLCFVRQLLFGLFQRLNFILEFFRFSPQFLRQRSNGFLPVLLGVLLGGVQLHQQAQTLRFNFSQLLLSSGGCLRVQTPAAENLQHIPHESLIFAQFFDRLTAHIGVLPYIIQTAIQTVDGVFHHTVNAAVFSLVILEKLLFHHMMHGLRPGSALGDRLGAWHQRRSIKMGNDLRFFLFRGSFVHRQPVCCAADALIQPGDLLIERQLLIQNIQLRSNRKRRILRYAIFFSLFRFIRSFFFFCFFVFFRFLARFDRLFTDNCLLWFRVRLCFFDRRSGSRQHSRVQFSFFLRSFLAAHGVAALSPVDDRFWVPIDHATSQKIILDILQQETIISKGMQRIQRDRSCFFL